MQPRPLHAKADLLNLIAGKAPTRACEKAISKGDALVLGGFTPTGGLLIFVVKVWGQHGSEWYIGVEVDEEAYEFRIKYLDPDSIPWACWAGSSTGKRLIDGETPKRCAFKRLEARRAARKEAENQEDQEPA